MPDVRARSASDDSAPQTREYASSSRAAMRCTAPMKAPSPPPTMPRRTRWFGRIASVQAEHAPVRLIVRARGGEVIERLFRHLDHMVADERGTFACALLR